MLAGPALVSDITSAQQMMLVTNQLALLAKELQTLSTSLNTPLGALALTSSGASSQQLALLSGYFADLGKAFPTITSDASYQSILSHLAKLDDMSRQMTSNPPSDLTAALAALKAEVDGIAADTLALQKTFAAQTPPAQFVPQDLAALSALQTGAAAAPDPAKSAQRLADDLTALTAFAKAQLPDATFRPTGIPLSESVRQSLAQLKEDTTSLQAALNRLAADTSKGTPIDFVPKSFLSDPKTSSLLSHFVSADGQSTQLTVVLKATPYSVQANRDVESLLPRVQDAAKAAGLQAVMGGAPVVLDDVEVIMSTDFMRIAVLTLVGVLIVLILLLRSLVAPIYLVLTVLLSYGSTIGVSTIVFQYVLQQEGVNYIIPIIVFVLLVALGADYNIFLMSRVREESEGRGTREGIRIASAYTGSIITSCGIILAGTFAAMMVAPIQTLFQVGFAVAAGVLVDTFVIRAVLVPAIAATLGERNWWPSRIKPKA
jgi:RND superfamily putative drug exporter